MGAREDPCRLSLLVMLGSHGCLHPEVTRQSGEPRVTPGEMGVATEQGNLLHLAPSCMLPRANSRV